MPNKDKNNIRIEEVLGSLGKKADQLLDKAPAFFEENIKKPMEEVSDRFTKEFESAIKQLKEKMVKYRHVSHIDLNKDFPLEEGSEIQLDYNIISNKGIVSIMASTSKVSETYTIEVDKKEHDITKTIVYFDSDTNEIFIEIPKKDFILNS
jgi:hypothetical protein